MKKILILFVLAILALTSVIAQPNGVGSPDNECQDNGFDFGIAKYECENGIIENGSQADNYEFTVEWTFDEEEEDECYSADWTADPAVDGVLSKEGTDTFVYSGGTSGTITQGTHSISHITLCGNTQVPICGDGVVNQLSEFCELPDTSDNSYCSQSTSACQGTLTGTRDAYGACDSECSCEGDIFSYSCVKGSCGADCAVNADCDDQNVHTTDICNADCGCVHTPIPYCGDGNVDSGEDCEQFIMCSPFPMPGQDPCFPFGPFQECTVDQKEGIQYCESDCTWSECDPIEYCGDGIVNNDETCDDGNLEDGDGCSANCTYEPGVPEFNTVTLGITVVLAGLGLVLLRKR